MVRKPVLAMFATLAIVLGCVVVATPAGAVVDTAVIVPSPNVASDDALSSVSCVSASECVAVGYTDTGSTYETLAMVWNGSVWSIVSSPNVTSDNGLFSVSCVSVSECVAVGYSYGNSATETLVMVWNGTVWSIVSSPNAGTRDNQLYSVSCVSASQCVAVGSTDTDSATETLVMVWDGTVWSIVSSPNAGTINDRLRSVSCVTISRCVAVGAADNGSGTETDQTLLMVWDGTVWSIVSSPNVASDDALSSVSCVSVSSCVAAGYSRTGSANETLVLSLTGPVPPSTTTTTVASDPAVPAFTG